MNKKIKSIHTAVIGAGTAGMFAFSRALKHNRNSILFEAGEGGTTCSRSGCMPSKMLIHAADVFQSVKNSSEEGVETGEFKLDTSAMMHNLREKRDYLADNMIKRTDRKFGKHLVRSRVKFNSPGVLETEDTLYECEKIIVATGSEPSIPGNWKVHDRKIVTTDTFFELPEIPERILVIGLGAIGAEISLALARLGKKVTGVEMMDTVAGIRDDDIKKTVLPFWRKFMDIRLESSAKLKSVGDKVYVDVKDINIDKTEEMKVDLVLVAAGRKPRTSDLELENAGIKLDKRKMPVINRKKLKAEGAEVYFAGDVSAIRPFYHDAELQGRFAGDYSGNTEINEQVPLSVVFTFPQIAVAGNTEENDRVFSVSIPLRKAPRTVVSNNRQGLVKIFVDKKTETISGTVIASDKAENLIMTVTSWIASGMKVSKLMQLPFYHPTYEEILKSVLILANKKLK